MVVIFVFFKINFERSKYLHLLPNNMFKSLLKFRTRNHKLPIETGRCAGIWLSERKCKLCFNDVGDEYHYLLCCKHFRVERTQFIKPYYLKRAKSIKYRDLMNTEIKHNLKISMQIYTNYNVKSFANVKWIHTVPIASLLPQGPSLAFRFGKVWSLGNIRTLCKLM